MTHALDLERILSLLRMLINKLVKIKTKGLVTKRRDDLRILHLINCILDVALSVSASVVASLLLLSGDIEENPGPGKEHRCINFITIMVWPLCCTIIITDLDYESVDATQILSKLFYTLLYIMCISIP